KTKSLLTCRYKTPTKYELAINLISAKSPGLTVAPVLLARVNDVGRLGCPPLAQSGPVWALRQLSYQLPSISPRKLIFVCVGWKHISGSRVFHVSNDTAPVHQISGRIVRLDRVMEAYDGDRAFYGPHCGGVCRNHRRARADFFGPRTCNNEPDT